MTQTINLDGVDLHYEESGNPEGEPVIIMHGWGCNHTTVASIANSLQEMRVINVDLPGHGESSEPSTVWGVNEFTENIQHFIDALKLRNPSLVGHSFGGRISILLSSRNKDINKVMLVDAAGIKPSRPLKYYIKVYSYKFAKKTLPIIFGKKTGGKLIDKWRNKSGSADYRNSSPMMRAVMSKCVNEDLRHVMPQIQAPTLLVWGSADTATPLSDAKIMEKLIPNAGLVNFDGCGHYSFLDNPGQFRAVAREFFKNEISKVSRS